MSERRNLDIHLLKSLGLFKELMGISGQLKRLHTMVAGQLLLGLLILSRDGILEKIGHFEHQFVQLG